MVLALVAVATLGGLLFIRHTCISINRGQYTAYTQFKAVATRA